MTVVQEVAATESFLAMPEEIRKCAKNESLGDCVTSDYLARVLAQCSCLQHALGGAGEGGEGGEAVCGPRDYDCVAALAINTGHCLVPCNGLYADVKDSNKLRLQIGKQPKYKLLEQEYKKYKYFNELDIKTSSYPGIST